MARRGENIHKRNDGRWEGRYIKARTPDRRICWGYIYGTTYAEVKQRLIHKKSEYGGFQLIDAHLTFTELAEAWLQSVKCGLKESTCAHYQYTLYKYVLPILGTVPISRLEENILEQALQKIIAPPDGQHKELGFSSARECLSMVRRICKYAVHLRLIRPMELSAAREEPFNDTALCSRAKSASHLCFIQSDAPKARPATWHRIRFANWRGLWTEVGRF